ncbi:aquaporin-3-like protein [Cricetulus griseus]|nr:aquaporin-3-like protein [Cricetulus griseus]
MGRQKELVNRCGEMLHIRYRLLRQALAECLGTLILVMFGCGSVAQVVLSRGTHGGFLTINLAFGFAVTLAILVAGQVSGAHLNPAVTFAMCFLAREPWIKLPIYTLAQTLGAFLGAGIVFGLYYDAIWAFANNELIVSGPNGTAGIFATYPSGHLDMVNGFFDQFIGTASLIVCVLAIVDPYNNPVPRGLEAFTVGLVVLVIGTSMGFNSGYAVNPARDFGPRLFTALAGWGSEVFTTGRHWWWVPIVSPLLGSIAGVFVYQLMIGCHLEQPPPSTEAENVKLAHMKHKEQASVLASPWGPDRIHPQLQLLRAPPVHITMFPLKCDLASAQDDLILAADIPASVPSVLSMKTTEVDRQHSSMGRCWFQQNWMQSKSRVCMWTAAGRQDAFGIPESQ